MILHIDLDCFFVSAERIKTPALIGEKVAVVGGNSGEIFGETQSEINSKSIICSASYEARAMGVRSAQPLFLAYKTCPGLVAVRADYHFYKSLSESLHKFLLDFTPDVEKYSIDEFFMDMKGTKYENDELNFAKNLQNLIAAKLNLPCSIGVASGKSLAKFGTNLAKPHGVKIIKDDEAITNLSKEKIDDFPGIGKTILKTLNTHGVYTLKDAIGAKFIFENLGKNGLKIYSALCGEDKEISRPQKPKNISIARTFSQISDRNEIKRRILILCSHLCYEIYKNALNPTKFNLKIKYANKLALAHSITENAVFDEFSFKARIMELFDKCDKKPNLGIIYVGVGVGGFDSAIECGIFDNKKAQNISTFAQKIREKYGVNLIKTAKELKG